MFSEFVDLLLILVVFLSGVAFGHNVGYSKGCNEAIIENNKKNKHETRAHFIDLD